MIGSLPRCILFWVSQIYFGRLIPIAATTIFAGAFPYAIAIDVADGWDTQLAVQNIFIYIQMATLGSVAAFILLMIPSAIVWNIAFHARPKLLSDVRNGATFASGVTAFFGNAFVFLVSVGIWRDLSQVTKLFLPVLLLPFCTALVVTWMEFKPEESEQP